MKYHFLYKKKEIDIYSHGVNIYAPNLLDAILLFEKDFGDTILLAIFTPELKK
jgi:hypothetical protein